MSSMKTIDPVFELVQVSVRQFGFFNNRPMGQQILLLGDLFYGYRFTTGEFTAVWSATDQTLTVFDHNGRCLGSTFLEVPLEEPLDMGTSIHLPEPHIGPQSRRAA